MARKKRPEKKKVKPKPDIVAMRCAIHDTPVKVTTENDYGSDDRVSRWVEIQCGLCREAVDALNRLRDAAKAIVNGPTTPDEKEEAED